MMKKRNFELLLCFTLVAGALSAHAQSHPQKDPQLAAVNSAASLPDDTPPTENTDAPVRHNTIGTSVPTASTQTPYPVLDFLLNATQTNPIGLRSTIHGQKLETTWRGKPVIKNGKPVVAMTVNGGVIKDGLQSVQGDEYELFCPADKQNEYLEIGKVMNGITIGTTSGILVSGDTVKLNSLQSLYLVSVESYNTRGNSVGAENCIQNTDGTPGNCKPKPPSLPPEVIDQLPKAAAIVNYLCEHPPADPRQHDSQWDQMIRTLAASAKGALTFFAKADEKLQKIRANRPVAVLATNAPLELAK